jgi:hypothetical protein
MFEADEARRLIGELVAAMTRATGESLGGAAQFDLAPLDDASLRSTVQVLEKVRRSLDATVGHALVELHERGATVTGEALATSTWLAREAQQAGGVARERLSAALKLRRYLPVVDDRLSVGRVGWQHVEVFARATNARNADAMGDASETLCDLAEQMGFEEWREAVLAVGRRLDPDGAEPGHRERSYLRVSPTEGFAALHGVFVGADAVVALQSLNDKADELVRAYVAERDRVGAGRVPPRSELLAEAFVELCRQAKGVDPDTARAPRTDAAVLVHCDGTLADPATPPEAALSGSVVVTTAEGLRVPMSDAAMLLCNAVVSVVALSGDGRPSSESRRQYRPSAAQRRALELRDGGCTFPGCRIKAAWADAHHVEAWPTGPTSLDNLALLCRRHHGDVHRQDWSVELLEDGWTRWTHRDGITRWGQRHRRTRAGP